MKGSRICAVVAAAVGGVVLAAPANARYTFDLDGTNGLYTLNGPNPCAAGPVGVTTFTMTPA
jgi:hypothetical protein